MTTITQIRRESQNLSRFIGAALGAAIGDALGAPTEFKGWGQIQDSYGQNGIEEYHRYYGAPVTYTDDTQMAIALAEGILQAPEADLTSMLTAIGVRFQIWSRSQEIPSEHRAPGNTCLEGCAQLDTGRSAVAKAWNGSKGNGAVMRVWPVALAFQHDIRARRRLASRQAFITHGHDTAAAVSVYFADLLAILLQGRNLMEAVEQLAPEVPEGSELAAAIAAAHAGVEGSEGDARVAGNKADPGGGWTADGALASCLAICLLEPDDFDAAVIAAANLNGDSDTIACMVGALMGAAHPDIAQRWTDGLVGRFQLEGLAIGLHRFQAAYSLAASY